MCWKIVEASAVDFIELWFAANCARKLPDGECALATEQTRSLTANGLFVEATSMEVKVFVPQSRPGRVPTDTLIEATLPMARYIAVPAAAAMKPGT